MDAAGDDKFGDGAKIDGRQLRYYLLKVTGAARSLTAPLLNTDWGDLAVGTRVVDGEYYWLVYKPQPLAGVPARWYEPGKQPRLETVPVDLLLVAGFDMSLAQLSESSSLQQRRACARGAVVLSLEEHQSALAGLRRRG